MSMTYYERAVICVDRSGYAENGRDSPVLASVFEHIS